jgi:hypothetical protein
MQAVDYAIEALIELCRTPSERAELFTVKQRFPMEPLLSRSNFTFATPGGQIFPHGS